MDTNSKRMLEALPDFDRMFELIEEIKKLSLSKMRQEAGIKTKESEVFAEVMTDPKYLVGGKQPAVNYFDNAYKYSGIDGNLVPLREALMITISEIEAKKSEYELHKEMLDMFKTLVYQEKGMI